MEVSLSSAENSHDPLKAPAVRSRRAATPEPRISSSGKQVLEPDSKCALSGSGKGTAQGTTQSDAPQTISEDLGTFGLWAFILLVDALMLSASNLVFSYSSFKFDLKVRHAWDEPTVAIVWSCASAGMNFMVHLGWLYDRYGANVAGIVAMALKLTGLVGMSLATHHRMESPWLFGLCFFLDAQATGTAITLGQSEALRASPSSRAGTAVSVAKSAFALGPLLWAQVYRGLVAPQIEFHFFVAGIVGVALMAALLAVLRTVPAQAADPKAMQNKAGALSLSTVLLSFDSAVICGTVSVVTWGSALVWISNIGSFAIAAGFEKRSGAIQSSFFTANMLSRLAIGPLMDALPLTKQFWVLIASCTMVLSSVLMLMSGGASLPLCAVVAGASFGADASMCPVMCRFINKDHQATLYSIAKMGGLVVSTVWIWRSSIQAEQLAAGAASCVGEACYHGLWVSMLVVTVPSVCTTAVWASRTAKHDKFQ